MLIQINAQTEHAPDLAEVLVERATFICGTREALAKRIGVTTKTLREIASGKTSMRYPAQIALEAIIHQAEYHGSALISHARMYATAAHSGMGQRRKYVNTPYIEHPHAVANLVASHFTPIEADAEHSTHEAIAAAWLHDVVEDTAITLEALREDFPSPVVELVRFVTKPTRFKGETNREHMRRTNKLLAEAPIAAQTIKAADILDNIHTLECRAGAKGIPYLMAKAAQLDVLHRAPDALKALCRQNIEEQERLMLKVAAEKT